MLNRLYTATLQFNINLILKTNVMEKNEKKCQVWMLPTDKADNVPFLRNIDGRGDRLYPATKGYYYTQAYLKEQQFEANHLYITSDDEIKELP